jgi:uncharacterized RDD family membrane protein YckC/cytoskeletal protein CcmA (bactofilin family)
MKRRHLLLFPGLVALILTIAPVTRGEDSSPAPSAEKTVSPPAAQAAQPETALAPAAPAVASGTTVAGSETGTASADTVGATQAPQAGSVASADSSSSALRRLDNESAETAGDSHAKLKDVIRESVRKHAHKHASGGNNNERVSIGHDTYVGEDEKAEAAVSILGSTTVDGDASDAAVSILGNTTVNGSVGDATVAVMGSVHVNGYIGGDVVAVGGNIELGPNAVVNGQVVVVGGTLQKDPAAVVHGKIQQISIMQQFPKFDWLYAWVTSALFKGRLLSFASGTGWAWMLAAAFLGLYVLCALIFPRGVEKCVETLEQRPGFTFLTALLTMLAMPLVFLLLAITGVGLLVIPFLSIGMLLAKLLGRATMLAWFGRRLTGLFGGSLSQNIVVNVLLGGIVVMLLYAVPIVAFIVSMLIGFLGLGAVIYTLLLSMRRNSPKHGPAAPATPPPPPAAAVASALPLAATGAPGVEPTTSAAAGPAVAPPVPPLVISAMTLPHAGFVIRTAALLIDLILCILVIEVIPWVHFHCGLILLVLAAYGAVMWKLRGTTVGGSICHLKVVRVDDRPLDWTVAIVRSLSCFLSLFVIGLGFLWVAIDTDKQAWHDKIAGTAVVKVPKSVALI